jgi:hypothetical protein
MCLHAKHVFACIGKYMHGLAHLDHHFCCHPRGLHPPDSGGYCGTKGIDGAICGCKWNLDRMCRLVASLVVD